MPSRRENLEAKAKNASTKKYPLKMDQAESLRLRDALLWINRASLQMFDCLAEDEMSEHDVFTLLQMPDYLNDFTMSMQRHVKTRIASGH